MQQQEEKVGTATRKHDFTDIMCIRRRWRGPGEGGCGAVNGQEEAAPQSQVPRRFDDWMTRTSPHTHQEIGLAKARQGRSLTASSKRDA